MRTGKELILATREYAKDDTAKSWWVIVSTFSLLTACMIGCATLPHGSLKLAASVISGLLVVRMFVIYHDHQHHAILPKSKFAKSLMRAWGVLAMTPSSIWQHSHNHHHNHNSKLRSAHIGSYPIMTTERFQNSSRKKQLEYLAIRHPLTIFCGYITVFILGMCIVPMSEDIKEHRDSLLALILHAALYTLVILTLGWSAAFLLIFFPCFIAGAIGSYLFYAQHNFPQVCLIDKEGWSYEGAALESSSYCKMGPIMNYMTANIGYHHIHHLNAKIPFYRLPEVFKKMPELQSPKNTSLHPMEILRCLRLKVWDVQQQCMVALPKT